MKLTISCSVKGINMYELQCCLCYDDPYLAVEFPCHPYLFDLHEAFQLENTGK